MKIGKCQNLNSLVREINFLELLKYFRNFQMLKVVEEFKKIGTPFGTLVHVRTLTRRHVDHAGTHGTHGTRFSKLPFSEKNELHPITITIFIFQKGLLYIPLRELEYKKINEI